MDRSLEKDEFWLIHLTLDMLRKYKNILVSMSIPSPSNDEEKKAIRDRSFLVVNILKGLAEMNVLKHWDPVYELSNVAVTGNLFWFCKECFIIIFDER